MDNDQGHFKSCVLYYPTIRIPPGQWLKQTVLYWDEVGSIVPKDYGGNWLIRKSHDLEYLIGEGQFYPFDPKQLSDQRPEAHKFVDELKAIIESKSYQKLLPPTTDRLFDAEIHLDKVCDLALEYLLNQDFARLINPDGKRKEDWIFFERTTAFLYMSLLAKYLARIDERNAITIPGTDQPVYQELSFQPQTENNEVGIEVRLRNWLPLPDSHVPIQEIVAFKRKRQSELQSLQSLMFDFEKQLKKAESIEEVKGIAYEFDRNKQKGVGDLVASLKDDKVETKWGSLNILMGVSVPSLLGILAGKIAEAAQISDPVVTGMIAFGITASIALRAYYVSRHNVVNKTLRDSPYSYLFHAQQEFILPG